VKASGQRRLERSHADRDPLLAWLDAAPNLNALRAPPGNRLEALTRDRVGQHSIRVNDQFRLCFNWTANGPENVECVDYH
jgi:proteic killer suppression protein